MKGNVMLITLLEGLMDVLFILIVDTVLKLALTKSEKPTVGDVDFEEFYLDLFEFDLAVDFSREQAEGLYRVWQRQSNSTARIVETRKGDNNT